MIEQPVDLGRDEEEGDIHVYPTLGREHVLQGLRCWCHPERDSECATVVVHRELH